LRFLPPVFTSFRVINGPEVYSGTQTSKSGVVAVKNYVYTLEALQVGSFTIPAAAIVMNGRQWQSNSVPLNVISNNATQQNEKGISDQQLMPGEDPYKKMNQNLFLKLLVNRTSCFVGEPVLATFKLYSRLSSKSDIVKNPGFMDLLFLMSLIWLIINQQQNRLTENGLMYTLYVRYSCIHYVQVLFLLTLWKCRMK
jgi:hypothetical protein